MENKNGTVPTYEKLDAIGCEALDKIAGGKGYTVIAPCPNASHCKSDPKTCTIHGPTAGRDNWVSCPFDR